MKKVAEVLAATLYAAAYACEEEFGMCGTDDDCCGEVMCFGGNCGGMIDFDESAGADTCVADGGRCQVGQEPSCCEGLMCDLLFGVCNQIEVEMSSDENDDSTMCKEEHDWCDITMEGEYDECCGDM